MEDWNNGVLEDWVDGWAIALAPIHSSIHPPIHFPLVQPGLRGDRAGEGLMVPSVHQGSRGVKRFVR